MAHLLMACPKCHAAYKIQKEFAQTEVACRACGHRWIPAHVMVEASHASPPSPPERPLSPLEAMAQVMRGGPEPHPEKALPLVKPSPPPTASPPEESPIRAVRSGAPAEKSAEGSPARGEAEPSAVPIQVVPSAPRDEKTGPLVGTAINGFKILGRIGSGGFGVVYRAFDTTLERSVAIKMLPPRIAKAGRGLIDRFLREARSAAKLSHPNIVTVHQICPYKDTFYIVMELVDGGTLNDRLAAEKRIQPAEATRIIRAAAEGLGHAHRRGIIHRDIKPANIMMTSDGHAKVSDFGLARDVLQGRDIVGPGHSLGTPRYMAPEQALGEEPTAASDLYSLAATYFTLLTGHVPFEASSDREMMKKHVTEQVPDPRRFVPTLPVAVFRFFEKAMAKVPEDRHVTAEAFIAAMDRLEFSSSDDGTAPTPQALSAQIGPIAVEDRGVHLTEALDRAVRRAQRAGGTTPYRVGDIERPVSAAPPKVLWKLWLLIGAGVVVLIAVAVAIALVLAPGKPASSGAIAPHPTPPSVPSPEKPAPPASITPPPTGKPPTGKPPESSNPLEEAAQAALKEAREYAALPTTPAYEAIRVYRETVLDVYPNTRAAKEAQKAVDQLKAASGEP